MPIRSRLEALNQDLDARARAWRRSRRNISECLRGRSGRVLGRIPDQLIDASAGATEEPASQEERGRTDWPARYANRSVHSFLPFGGELEQGSEGAEGALCETRASA